MTEPIITVRGEAQRQGPPDLGTLTITVVSNASTGDQVRAELAAASTGLRDILQPREASLESWSTSGLHVTPVFRQRGTKIIGYRGSVTTTAVLKDLQAVSDLVFAVGPLPGASVSGPWWSLRPSSPLYREARLAAIADARRRAEDYAAAFGGAVGPVIEVSDLDGGFGGSPHRMYAMAAGGYESADDASIDLEPALQEVHGQVTVRFALLLPA